MLPRANFKAKGEEFVKKLREQQIKLYSIDAPALVNVIASGEIAASPAIFESHTVLAASKGAALEWPAVQALAPGARTDYREV